MNGLVYNKLIMRLHSTDNVGEILTDPALSVFDVKKAITQGSPIVRLKLLTYCINHPRYLVHVDAFFEQEAHNINFGKTSLSWVEGFSQHNSTIMSYVFKHLQPIHYKDFIVGCAQRANENQSDYNDYNRAFLYDIFRLPNWPKNTIPLVLDCVKNKSLEWKSLMAIKVGHTAKTQGDQNLVLDFVKNMPSLHFSDLRCLRWVYELVTPRHTPLLEACLNKLSLENFKELLAELPEYWDPEQYQILAEQLPNDMIFKKLFFEKITDLYNKICIDDHVHARMERWWLEANIPTTPVTSYKRKM